MSETNTQPKDCFEIGGEDLLASAPTEAAQESEATEGTTTQPLSPEALHDIRVRVGTLLKTETVSFLLGAGASVDCGGPLIGTVPLTVERDLLGEDITGSQNRAIDSGSGSSTSRCNIARATRTRRSLLKKSLSIKKN